MFYKKSLSGKARRRGWVYVKDFSTGISTSDYKTLVPYYSATSSYNTQFKSGALTDGFGVKKAVFSCSDAPEFKVENVHPKAIYYYKKFNSKVGLYSDYLLVYGTDGNFYKAIIGESEGFEIVENLSFEKKPFAVNYNYAGEDVIIFSIDGVIKVYNGESVTEVSDAPGVTSICLHNERLFATEDGQKTKLWFSDDFNPLNWNLSLEEAGYIDLREGIGTLLKVVSFNGYVYVFRNYGISRVSAYGDQSDFSVDSVTSSGKIYANSIAVCQNRAIYLAEDGFYSFSGGTPTRILKELDGLLKSSDNQKAKAVYFNGDYYCLLNLTEDNFAFQALLRYETASGEFSLSKDLKIEDFAVMEGENDFKLLFLCGDNSAIGELSQKSEYFSGALTKSWQSGKSDLGVRKEKCLTSICVNTKTPLKVVVQGENQSRVLHFKGGKKREKLPVGIRSEYFTFTILCDSANCEVSYLSAEFEYEGA